MASHSSMKEKIGGKYSKNSMWHPNCAGNISPVVTLNMRDLINAISPEQKCNSLLLRGKKKNKTKPSPGFVPSSTDPEECSSPVFTRDWDRRSLLAKLKDTTWLPKGISHWTRPAECTLLAHFFRSILAKSALDIFLGSAGGSEDAAGEFWTIPFSALATGLL